MDKKFFDIHFHAFTLSHPDITAFLNRVNLNKITLPIAGFLGGILSLVTDVDDRIRNLLSMMENDLGNFFLYLEYYLRNSTTERSLSQITDYNKIILTPLMVDFGYNAPTNRKILYSLPPQKPVINQVADLFQGIQKYYNYDISITKNASKQIEIDYLPTTKEKKLFEIYPFVGINPRLYRDEEHLSKFLNKYFSEYASPASAPKQLYNKYYEKFGLFNGDVYDKSFNFNFIFSGIKLYPPLDFDPWPTYDAESRKVRFLYNFCQERNIPITVHCSDGGFQVIEKNRAWSYTSISRWTSVLQSYPNLKINFAHFGSQANNKSKQVYGNWRDGILSLIESGDYPNVYTDFSCLAMKPSFYRELKKIADYQSDKFSDHLLFGSDFMINLLWSHSYNEYLKYFFQSKEISAIRDRLCVDNPSRFIFGGAIG